MVSKLQKKGKKGFTLVELIVVIAIIAILAAVAVPTTLHFVDEANISAELQAVSPTRDSAITYFTGKAAKKFDVSSGNALLADIQSAIPVTESVESIVFTVEGRADSKFDVTVTGKGVDYDADKSGYVDEVVGTYTKSQIFASATEPAGTVPNSGKKGTLTITVENGAITAVAWACSNT